MGRQSEDAARSCYQTPSGEGHNAECTHAFLVHCVAWLTSPVQRDQALPQRSVLGYLATPPVYDQSAGKVSDAASSSVHLAILTEPQVSSGLARVVCRNVPRGRVMVCGSTTVHAVFRCHVDGWIRSRVCDIRSWDILAEILTLL